MRIVLILLFLLASPAFAECHGSNLFTTMPKTDRARLEQAAAMQPFHKGNLWRATKDGMQVTLAGTYHLGDPRHAALMARLTPLIDATATVLVEAGPAEEAALKAEAARDPLLFVLTDTSLPQIMPAADWQALSTAMARRGIPGFMAAKFQPWYVAMLLAVPPCMIGQLDAKTGLDALIIQHATTRDIPLRGLEPHDTVFNLFGAMSQGDQVALLRASLALEDRAEDYITTLADSYFAGDSRLIWELMRDLSLALPGYTPEQVEADLAKMEQALVITRNQSWVPVIEAAARTGPAFAAFGALHLPGQYGIPNLLQQNGWTLTPLSP
ncbi:MAG: TraB/GumN family protein [Rhodobacteraceae bacterium]|nr:TraB/GumN family protein [Paracoccaceae bacterium]